MILALIVLSVIIIAQAIERYLFSKTMLKQLDDCIKASMSRNINEYLSATNSDVSKKREFSENDEIPLEQADEEQFDKFIKTQTS